jgi:hypothetical protein
LKSPVYKGLGPPVFEDFPGAHFLPMCLEPLVLLTFLQFRSLFWTPILGMIFGTFRRA